MVIVFLSAKDTNLVLENFGKGFVDYGSLIVGGEANITMEVLSFLVVLSTDVFILFVVDGSILFSEEDFVLDNENIFSNYFVFSFFIFPFSLNHAQVVQNNVAEIICIIIFEKLDLSVNQCQ